MRIGFSQFNPILGNIDFNFERIIEETAKAHAKRCEILIFPELALFGYMPQDLLERRELIKYQEKKLSEISRKIPPNITLIVGCVRRIANSHLCYNSAAIIEKGKKNKYVNKILFPTYDVFDETRYYKSGKAEEHLVKIKNQNIIITICEDLWVFDKKTAPRYENPFNKIKKKKIDLVINISASPFTNEKMKERLGLCKKAVQYFKAPLIYTNMVGAQDELIFDGRSFAINKAGKILTQSLAFQEDLNMVDFAKNEAGKRHHLPSNKHEDLRQALVLGIRDFVRKIGFSKVHLGLSGGIDSALVACLAADAVGPQNVHCIALPTQFNASESYSLAKNLAANLGVSFQSIDIEKIFQVIKDQVDESFKIESFNLVHENLQARIRGLILMAYSNKTASVLLSTGNKTEFAMGYSTLYGDMCGGLAPLGDLLKKDIYALANLYNREHELIPQRIIDRPPSAELRPNQKDQDSLPPYEDLDPTVDGLITHGKAAKTEEQLWALQKIYQSEFKRRQAPPILKVTARAFGLGRRYPIAHKSALL